VLLSCATAGEPLQLNDWAVIFCPAFRAAYVSEFSERNWAPIFLLPLLCVGRRQAAVDAAAERRPAAAPPARPPTVPVPPAGETTR